MPPIPDKLPIKGYVGIKPPKVDFVPLPIPPSEFPTLTSRDIPTPTGTLHTIEINQATPDMAQINIDLYHSPRIRLILLSRRGYATEYEQDNHVTHDADLGLVKYMPERSRQMVVNMPPDTYTNVSYAKIPGKDQNGSDLLTTACFFDKQDNISCFRWMVSEQPNN